MKEEEHQSSGLKEMHAESMGWKSDLKFCLDEFNFFDKLLNSYQYVPDNKEDFDLRNDLVRDFEELRKSRTDIWESVSNHVNHMGGVFEKGESVIESSYEREHQAVKVQVGDFKLQFKSFKQKLFDLADHILENKKPGDLTS
ncbi:hypothetical protein [Robertkochia flava]|uniref:hypothetical protein n=1 Tax=Robertkochia flava TaxID=3447986 RepID=UPI001CC9E6E7|nr:hypothetical protein [Robertkochia marina]